MKLLLVELGAWRGPRRRRERRLRLGEEAVEPLELLKIHFSIDIPVTEPDELRNCGQAHDKTALPQRRLKLRRIYLARPIRIHRREYRANLFL